jgi:hypothetical protein
LVSAIAVLTLMFTTSGSVQPCASATSRWVKVASPGSSTHFTVVSGWAFSKALMTPLK